MSEPGTTGTVLEAGVPRSGNSWIYQILTSLHHAANIPWRSYIENHPIHATAKNWPLSLAGQAGINMASITPEGCYLGISSAFQERIDDFAEFVRSCLIVWTHSAYDRRVAPAFGTFAHVVYVIRDPRDVLVSLAHFRHTEYSLKFHPHAATRTPQEYAEQNADDLAWYWVKHVVSYLAVRQALGVHVAFYERFKSDPVGETRRLARALGLQVSEADLDAVTGHSTFDSMRANSPQHLRSGASGQWRTELTAAQAGRVEEIAGPLLELLGYADRPLPALPDGAMAQKLRESLDHARGMSARRCRRGWAV